MPAALKRQRSPAIRRAQARVQAARRHLRNLEDEVREQEKALNESQMHRREAANALTILKAHQNLLLIARDYLEREEARSRRG